jgi:hypothetical protein
MAMRTSYTAAIQQWYCDKALGYHCLEDEGSLLALPISAGVILYGSRVCALAR